MLVLFHASSSVACSKFIHTDNVLGDIKVCKQLHMVTNGKLFNFKFGPIYSH